MLHPAQSRNNPNRVTKYQECEHELSMTGIQYPVDIKDIGKFEHQSNISVNIYGYKDKKDFPNTYYHRGRWKKSHDVILYSCWWKISLLIDERL